MSHAQTMESSSSSLPPPVCGSAATRKSTLSHDPPAKQVFDTTELCENVLKYLDPKDLVRVQRLCRSTRSCIDSSPTLQEKLFLKPAPTSMLWVLHYGNDDILLGKKATEYIEGAKNPTSAATLSKRPHVYNELFFEVREHREGLGARLCDHCVNGIDAINASRAHLLMTLDGLRALPQSASCRAMYVAQPPVAKIRIAVMGRCDGSLREDELGEGEIGIIDWITVESFWGVKFEDVVEEIARRQFAGDESLGKVHCNERFMVTAEQKALVEGMDGLSPNDDPWCEYSAAARKQRTEGAHVAGYGGV